MLKAYREVRTKMHEVYKAYRAENDEQLYQDFVKYEVKKQQEARFKEDGDTPLKAAVRDGEDADKVKALLETMMRVTMMRGAQSAGLVTYAKDGKGVRRRVVSPPPPPGGPAPGLEFRPHEAAEEAAARLSRGSQLLERRR